MLDTLRPTSAGLAAWHLKVATRTFCNHLAYLFNLSLAALSVPHQWKEACIRPIPKVPAPQQPADFQPISITPILTRMMERAVVRSFLYPAFLKPPRVSHSLINMHFALLVPLLLPSSVSYKLSPACCSPIHSSSSFPWIFRRRSTLSATLVCSPRWRNWICPQLCTTGW